MATPVLEIMDTAWYALKVAKIYSQNAIMCY
jgi:hypothetical protein